MKILLALLMTQAFARTPSLQASKKQNGTQNVKYFFMNKSFYRIKSIAQQEKEGSLFKSLGEYSGLSKCERKQVRVVKKYLDGLKDNGIDRVVISHRNAHRSCADRVYQTPSAITFKKVDSEANNGNPYILFLRFHEKPNLHIGSKCLINTLEDIRKVVETTESYYQDAPEEKQNDLINRTVAHCGGSYTDHHGCHNGIDGYTHCH